MIAAAAALIGAVALAAYPVWVAPTVAALPPFGVVAVLVLAVALVLGVAAAVPGTIALLVSEIMISLLARRSEAIWSAAVYGVALLVVAELAFWSIQLRLPSRAEPGFFPRHALTIAGVSLLALGIDAAAGAVAGAPIGGSLALMAAGAGAIVVMLGIVVAIVWRSDARRT